MSRLLLIDGHSIINRAFYGVPDLTNASGLHVNAIYGFLNIMFKFIDEEEPDYLAVAFDLSTPTFRHEKFKEYKGTRKPMPEELREQVPIVKEVLQAMDVVTISKEGFEADDILGTLAKKAEAEGMEVSLVSGDRDLLQIATDKIKICLPKTKGGKTETEYYNTEDVLKRYQVSPGGIIELKALMGDSSDNIPGVPKVGEKTATALIVEYGTVENVYANLDKITKKGLHDTLQENREKAELSHFLATIKIDCELGITWEELNLGNIYTPSAYEMLKTLGLKKILARFEGRVGTESGAVSQVEFKLTQDFAEAENIFSEIEKNIDILYTYIHCNGEEKSISLSFNDNTYIIKAEGFITMPYISDKLQFLQEKPGFTIVTYDVKRIYPYLNPDKWQSLEDVMIMSYLINPLKAEELNMEEGYITLEMSRQFKGLLEELKEADMYKLYREVEMPLSRVLFDCEQTGILIDRASLQGYGEKLASGIAKLETKIYEQAGIEFNINSPKQLGEILFEKLGIPGSKKTKSGYSTAADVLEKLAKEHPIVADILEYRGLAKLKSTYADGLLDCIKEDGRIHTTFNQTITATGRISSTEPNLQNIPIRTSLGREIRKSFVPKEGYVFIDADYSQIELRLLAHMSKDSELIEAYNADADIHRITASKVFGIPFEEVTAERRRDAKAVNFGLVYGISSFGLSQDLGISRKEAEQYIEDYFITYPGVKAFLDNAVEDAKNHGFVTTLYGRRRPIPELKSSNYMMRQFGERVAMNSPIQGTAADIMKIAMIKVYNALIESKLDAKILVQVHDELLLEVKREETDKAMKLLHDEMKNAANLSVALEVDVSSGENWYETK